MKKVLTVCLILLLGACQASIIEENGSAKQSNEIDTEAVDSSVPDVVQNTTLRTLFLSNQELPRGFVQNLATHRRPDFKNFTNETELLEYQEVFFIYQKRRELQPMFFSFDLPEVAPYQYIVEKKERQTHIYLNPGEFVRQIDLFQKLNGIDFSTEGVFDLPFEFPLLDRTRSIESFGSIAVVTQALNDSDRVNFLPADRHEVFRNADEAMTADYDTYLFMYDQNNDVNYPKQNFGQVLNPGEILGIEVEGKTIILLRFSSTRRPELSQLTSNVLTLKGRVRIEEYLELSKGLMFSNEGFVSVPNPFLGTLTPLSTLSELEYCRITQPDFVTGSYSNIRAFPHFSKLPTRGQVNIAVLAVEFPNVPGEEEFLPIYQEQMSLIETWSNFVSNGKMQYVVHFPNQWIMAPKEAKYYTDPNARRDPNSQNKDATVGGSFQSVDESITQIIRAADEYIDWSIIDFAQFIFPYDSEQYGTFLYSHGGNYSTPKAGSVSFPLFAETVLNFHPYSPNPRSRTHWDWIVHEILHFQGIIGHGPINGGPFGIMMDQHAPSKALLSWEAFLMGFFDKSDVSCAPQSAINDPISVQLESLDELGGAPGNKGLMIPFNNNEILVIEYRTDGPFSELPEEFHGFVSYYIDANKPWIRCDQCDQTVIELENFWRFLRNETEVFECTRGYFNPGLCGQKSIVQKSGDTLFFRNLKIEFFDDRVVQVSRIN